MFVTISTEGNNSDPATDLGYLLHKHPDRVRTVNLGFGAAHVFYTEATAERCTAALFVDVDPVRLSRRERGTPATLEPYVNDRPYAASSFLAVAIGNLYRTAIKGVCNDRPELVDKPLALEVHLPTVPCRGEDELIGELFMPLGYDIELSRLPLDPAFPSWGESRFVDLTLRGSLPVKDALAHLVVLLPVLDNRKHYWIDQAEVDKLLDRGGAWLGDHPAKELIARRYLGHRTALARDALARLVEDVQDPDVMAEIEDAAEEAVEKPISLNRQRLEAVVAAVTAVGARRVVDLGCGEGRLLQQLLKDGSIDHVIGADVSMVALRRASKRLKLDHLSERQRARVELIQSSLTYRDERLEAVDVATVIEVIEHLDLERIDAFTGVLFGQTRPGTIVVTTPNVEYNANFEGMAPGSMRHGDHRFEWTRAEFQQWAADACGNFGYTAVHSGIGPADPVTGSPTQMAVFTRGEADVAPVDEPETTYDSASVDESAGAA